MRGRHGPNTIAPQIFESMQLPEQQLSPPSAAHASPDARHVFDATTQCPPGLQSFEQQSVSTWHAEPDCPQMPPPQTPPLQASEQQSEALVQGFLSGAQYGPQMGAPPVALGSHRPLQHDPKLKLQGNPGATQFSSDSQTFPTQGAP